MKKLIFIIFIFLYNLPGIGQIGDLNEPPDTVIDCLHDGIKDLNDNGIYYDCYNDYADSLFDRWNNQGIFDLKYLVSDMMDSLQLTGVIGGAIWDTADVIGYTCLHTEQASELNWKGDTFNLDTVGNLTWTAYYGFQGDGSSTYLNTNYNPSEVNSNGGKYQQNNASFAIGLDSIAISNEYHGCSEGSLSQVILPDYSGNAYIINNTATSYSTANTSLNRLFISNRIASNTQELYIDTNKYTGSQNSSGIPDYEIYLLARNNNGSPLNYSQNNLNFWCIGGGFTHDQIKRLYRLNTWFISEIRLLGLYANISSLSNRFLLQTLLDPGSKTVNISKPGIYDLDSAIFIDTGDTLIFRNNSKIRKSEIYSNVIINRGALTGTYDSLITIDGLHLIVNGKELGGEYSEGLEAQLGFLNVKYLTIKNFVCRDIGTYQFCFQFGRWEHLLMNNITIEGEKDGMAFLTGHDADISDVYMETGDDAIFLGGIGYPEAQPAALGNVSNMVFTNINWIDSTKSYDSRGCYVYLGSWIDWAADSTFWRGSFCLNAGKAYQCDNDLGFSGVAVNAPTHSSGSVQGEDGISWRFIDTASYYHTDVDSIIFDSCTFYDPASFLYLSYDTGSFMRNIYPGTETLPKADSFLIKNSSINNTRIINVGSNIYNTRFQNCIFDSTIVFIATSTGLDIDSIYVQSNNCTFTNKTGILASPPNAFARTLVKKIVWNSTNDDYTNSSFNNIVSYSGSLRVINNQTIPFDILTNLSPQTGDICTNLTGIYQWDGDSWEEYIP